MKTRTITLIIAMMLTAICSQGLGAQEYVTVDSLVYRPVSAVDSTLAGRDIFSVMPSRAAGAGADVNVSQSQAISGALSAHIAANPDRKLSGYRVRIFFDNGQNARQASQQTLDKFRKGHPGISAYRSCQNPYFKVTVGDFRTRSEALELLERIKSEYPSAFILKENINYPAVDREHAYIVDTVKVLRKAE